METGLCSVQNGASLKGMQVPKDSWRRPQLDRSKRLVYRKIIKPLMEKRRRDRIALCLNQLKALLIDSTGQGHKPLPNSRMDKAALLEMTVRRIQTLQLAVAEDKAFHTGYSYCASLIQAFLTSHSQRQLEASSPSDSGSSSAPALIPLAAPPPPPKPQRSCGRKEGNPPPAGLRCFANFVPPSIWNRTGSQPFWRPWST